MNMLSNAIAPLVKVSRFGGETRRNMAWTEDEKRLLLDLRAQKVPAPQIAKRLGRPVGAVYVAARKLGSRIMRYETWTPEADAALTAMIAAGDLSDAEIAEKLERTYASVRWRIGALGLKGQRPVGETPKETPKRKARLKPPAKERRNFPTANVWSDEEIRKLAVLSQEGKTSIADAARMIGRPLSGVRAKAKALWLTFPTPQEIEGAKADDALKAVWPVIRDLSLVAARLGRSKTWVRVRTLELGLRTEGQRNSRPLDDVAKAEIRDLAARMSVTEIAKAVRRDVRTVKRVAEELGIALKRPERKTQAAASRIPKPRVRSAPKPKASTIKAATPAQMKVKVTPQSNAAASKPTTPVSARTNGADRLALMRSVLAKMRAEGRLP